MTAKEFHKLKGPLKVEHSRRDKKGCELTLAPGTSVTSNDLTRWAAWQVQIIAVPRTDVQSVGQLQVILREYGK